MISCIQAVWKNPTLLGSCNSILQSFQTVQLREVHGHLKCCRRRRLYEKKRGLVVYASLLPADPWAPDSQSVLASQLFAVSLFPYLGFLYFITKSKSAPKLTLFGFYFLLVFVGATRSMLLYVTAAFFSAFEIPAGIYAKLHYGTSLSNVDWLHGGAESLLTLTNLFIVLGLREGLRNARNAKESTSDVGPGVKEEKQPLP